MCNEAALIAARGGKDEVSMVDFEAATDRVIGGLEKRNKVVLFLSVHALSRSLLFAEKLARLVRASILRQQIAGIWLCPYIAEYCTCQNALVISLTVCTLAPAPFPWRLNFC